MAEAIQVTGVRRHGRDVWDVATGLLLLTLAVLIAGTFTDYGVTIDERHSTLNGRYFFNWYASGFHDDTIIREGNHRLYGSFFNSIFAFVGDHSSLEAYDAGHLLIAITSLIGVLFAYRLGRRIAGSMAGFFSALLLVLTPLYYGHSFMNAKDLPFAVLFLASIFYMTIAYDRLPRPGWKELLPLGLVIGLVLGIRVGGVMLFGYLGALFGLWLLARYRDDSTYRARNTIRDVRSGLVALVIVGFIAWVVMLVWWPYGQINPILNPLRAIKLSARFTDYGSTTLYRGEFVPADALPWHYLPTWFAINLPEFYGLIFAITLVAMLFRSLFKRNETFSRDVDMQSKLLFLVFSTCFPIMMAFLTRPILYDANRHFLFVVPPLAVLAGMSFAWLMRRGLPNVLKFVMLIAVAISLVTTAIDMTRLHPYEYIYFNRTFGGLKTALGRYETDYWGVSHLEGVNWLIRNYKVGAPKGSIRVATTAADFQTFYYLPPNRAETERFVNQAGPWEDNPDVLLTGTRWNAHLRYPGKVLHVVERVGVPLLYVVELTSRNARARLIPIQR